MPRDLAALLYWVMDSHVHEIAVDCDGDTLLLLVEPAGPACHTGAVSCFYRQLQDYETGDWRLKTND